MFWIKILAVCRKKKLNQHNSNGFRKENDSMANVPTPHIKAKMGEIAEKILKKRKIKKLPAGDLP